MATTTTKARKDQRGCMTAGSSSTNTTTDNNNSFAGQLPSHLLVEEMKTKMKGRKQDRIRRIVSIKKL